MKRRLFSFLIIFLSLQLNIYAQEDSIACDTIQADTLLPYKQRVHDTISQLLNKDIFNTSQVGLMVYDMDADSVMYAYNEHQLMRPASTMKLLTAVTALDQLTPQYRFTTKFYTTGEHEGNYLNGDLFIKGGMDPSFSEYDMKDVIEAVKALNIDTIKGNLVVDRSFKDELVYGSGWCWDDNNPMLSPLPYKRRDGFVNALRTYLDESGIAVLGCDSTGIVPEAAQPLIQITTNLSIILEKMMKESDNMYAESMLYNIGALSGGVSTAKKAQHYEKLLINKTGLNASNYRLADGSGLSLYNYLSPELEVAILRYAYSHKDFFDILYSSLPVAGIDGTLKKRMNNTVCRGNIHAKTGTVTGISSLAGYATSPEGHMLAFCIINQGIISSSKVKAFQDSVCKALCK